MPHPSQFELDDALLQRLRSLDADSLAQVLTNRPDLVAPPWPRRLDDLVVRMSDRASVTEALRHTPSPGLQVLRAVQLCRGLGDELPGVRTACARLGAATEDVDSALGTLQASGLAWIDGEGRVVLPEALHGDGSADYNLGQPMADLLPQLTVEQLRALARKLNHGVGGRKQEIVDGLLAFYREPGHVTALLGEAPDGTVELLEDCAWSGPEIDAYLGYQIYYGNGANARPVTPAKWAAERGLLWSTYQGTAHMPLEIGLAMRGPEYVLPFTPRPPSLSVATVTPGQVAAVSAASALRLIDRTLAVVESSAADPIPLLKTGRVGARAVTSMAKKTGAAAQEIRLAVELAIRLSLLQPRDLEPPPSTPARGRKTHARGRSKPPAVPPAALVPTDEFKIWRAQSSAARLLTLIEAWWELPIAPLADEKTIRAVLDDDPSRAFAHVRQLTVRLLTGLGGDTRVTDSSALTELVRWYAPMVSGDIVETLVAASMTEAGLLGVVATGAPSDVGRALVANTFVTGLDVDAPALVQAVEGFVANACTTALFGADLTAIVTGPADAELAGVLDRAADRESQGSATTWRFSSATVRRAFDDGADAASLLDELASVAHGDLPQPLVYMINDVARRHGEAWVVDVVCVVVGDDPVLMAEIAAHRKLAKLELHTLAPTVLGSAADSVTTLTALRDAGYAPVRQTANGRVVTRVERLPPATDSAPISSWSHGDDSFDVLQFLPRVDDLVSAASRSPREHAERLLAAPTAPTRRKNRGELTNLLYAAGSERFTPEWMQMIWSLEAGVPVPIDYREPDGTTRHMLIDNPELYDDSIDVWCWKTGDYRRLELSRIVPRES